MKSGLNMLKTVVAGLAALMLCIPYLPAHSAAQNAPAQETVATESGEVVLPDQKLIQAMTDEVRKDASLDENTKKERLAELENAMANLAALSQTKKDLFDLKKEIQGSSALLRRLSADLNKAERQYAQIPSCKDRTAKNIDELIDDLQEKAAAAQNELSAAASEYSSLQTLTERAQTAISQNNSALSALSSDIASQSDPGSPAVRIKALNMALLRAQNTLLQEQMQNHPLLLDLAGYRQRIAELKNTYYQKYLQNAVSCQRELISVADNSGDLDEDAIAAAAKESPALAKELAVNKKVSDYLTQYRQEAAALQGEAHSVEQALSSLKQLSASIDTEIKGLDKSLVLSRLLNRQQSQIPDIALSKNLDELIPDLTLWLYDVRERVELAIAGASQIITAPFVEHVRCSPGQDDGGDEGDRRDPHRGQGCKYESRRHEDGKAQDRIAQDVFQLELAPMRPHVQLEPLCDQARQQEPSSARSHERHHENEHTHLAPPSPGAADKSTASAFLTSSTPAASRSSAVTSRATPSGLETNAPK